MRPLLAVPESARVLQEQMVKHLQALLLLEPASPPDPKFRKGLASFLRIFERYQEAVVKTSPYRITCSRGCQACCSHWVDNVYSFEVEIIASEVRRRFGSDIPGIVAACSTDRAVFAKLERLFPPDDDPTGRAERLERLLDRFYLLGRPCALLGSDGSCRIYPVRPMMCRIYLSFSDPDCCRADSPRRGEVLTYLLDVDEEANDLLDRLDRRYRRFPSDTGLRSLLQKTLG